MQMALCIELSKNDLSCISSPLASISFSHLAHNGGERHSQSRSVLLSKNKNFQNIAQFFPLLFLFLLLLHFYFLVRYFQSRQFPVILEKQADIELYPHLPLTRIKLKLHIHSVNIWWDIWSKDDHHIISINKNQKQEKDIITGRNKAKACFELT